MKVGIVGLSAIMFVFSLLAMDSAELEKKYGIALKTIAQDYYSITYGKGAPVSFVFMPGNEESVLVVTKDGYFLGANIDVKNNVLEFLKLEHIKLESADKTKEYSEIQDVVVHPSTQALGLGLDNNELMFWGEREGTHEEEKDKYKPKRLGEGVSSLDHLTFACNGRALLAAYNKGLKHNAVRLWDIHKMIQGTYLSELGQHSNMICSLASAPYALLAASGSIDQKIKVWDLKDETKHFSLWCPFVPVDLSFSHDAKYLVGASGTNVIWVIDIARKNFLYGCKIKEGEVSKVICHPSKDIVALGCESKGILLFDLEHGTKLFYLPFCGVNRRDYEINKMQFSRLGTELGALVNNEQVHVWYNVMQQKKENLKKEEN